MTETELLDRIAVLENEVAYWKSEAIGNANARRAGALAAATGLTKGEAWVLLSLHDVAGKTISTTLLSENMPGKGLDRDADNLTNVSNVLVHRIRGKLGRDVIETVRGAGYRITEVGQTLIANVIPG